ncbi:FRG domain-containing protein [Bradyrhizobium liaoningense]|uniref:FRG domain-containing protein n=1 Tax=Bradyrhizobium liaoningense TaxID=43992 RepID=UPI001BA77D14|nr:FRG domain-containing protein [Bradyrhizobium liaoningense]MBR1069143.1 FRG domain-containing protein [Bradyrhizobium liaoningense]
MPLPSPKFKVQRFSTWQAFREVIESDEYKGWAFRGQSNADWPLYSSLSRYLMGFRVHPKAWSQQEFRILRIFKRKAHLLLNHLPDDEDVFQWLALMQHHGAPTRLLDFSWSPYVATFFAIERATSDVAVWALFPPGLSNRPMRTLRASQKVRRAEVAPWVEGSYVRHFLPNKHRLVVVGEPHTMNQRLIAQSGTFVMPGVLQQPIEALAPPSAVVKFVIDTEAIRRRAMPELYQMNVSNATLFPGLDGLARSLAYELEFHWAFDPHTMKKRKGFYVK